MKIIHEEQSKYNCNRQRDTNITTSQAVARIVERTATQKTLVISDHC